MNGRHAIAALHMRLRWCHALHVQQREPETAYAILAELLVQAYQDGAQAQKNGLHVPPLTISDNPDLVRKWIYGHDDTARGVHALVCDCATDICLHRQCKPVDPFAQEGEPI